MTECGASINSGYSSNIVEDVNDWGTDLWDVVREVKDELNTHQGHSEKLEQFFRELSKIHQQFGSAMNSLYDKYKFTPTKQLKLKSSKKKKGKETSIDPPEHELTYLDAFNKVAFEINVQGNQHVEVGEALKALHKKLAIERSQQRKRTDLILQNISKHTSEYEDRKRTQKKTEDKYRKAYQQFSLAKAALDEKQDPKNVDPKGNNHLQEIERAQKQKRDCQTVVHQIEKDFASDSEVLERAHLDFYGNTLRHDLTELHQVEVDRIEVMREGFQKLFEEYRKVEPILHQSVENIEHMQRRINPAEDTKQVTLNLKTGNKPLPPPKFYSLTNPANGNASQIARHNEEARAGHRQADLFQQRRRLYAQLEEKHQELENANRSRVGVENMLKEGIQSAEVKRSLQEYEQREKSLRRDMDGLRARVDELTLAMDAQPGLAGVGAATVTPSAGPTAPTAAASPAPPPEVGAKPQTLRYANAPAPTPNGRNGGGPPTAFGDDEFSPSTPVGAGAVTDEVMVMLSDFDAAPFQADDGSTVISARKDQRCFVIEKTEDWTSVRLEGSGLEGFVPTAYLGMPD